MIDDDDYDINIDDDYDEDDKVLNYNHWLLYIFKRNIIKCCIYVYMCAKQKQNKKKKKR